MAKRSRSSKPESPGNNYFLRMMRSEAEQRIAAEIVTARSLLDQAHGISSSSNLDELQRRYWNWRDRATELLTRMFSNDRVRESFENRVHIAVFYEKSLSEKVSELQNDVRRDIGQLESILGRLDLIDAPDDDASEVAASHSGRLDAGRVFVVHGHDEAARESVARAIEKFGLEAVILNEQANEGRTIIEKFEAHSSPGFAVVLLTPDDVGGKSASDLRPRARQNVVLELGFFMGKLGRGRVLALVKGEIEIPSDISGVVYERMDQGDNWKFRLGKELRAANIEVDLNLL